MIHSRSRKPAFVIRSMQALDFSTIYGTIVCMKVLNVIFYKKSSGTEPVKDWLKDLSKEDMKLIGQDLKTVEFGWPMGMPLVRKLDKLLWEVRINLTSSKIARVLFTVKDSTMVLLHGFIKKSQKTPDNDLKLGKTRRDHILEA